MKKGDSVICIDASGLRFNVKKLTLGKKYTISYIENNDGVILKEIKNDIIISPIFGTMEKSYKQSRFKLISDESLCDTRTDKKNRRRKIRSFNRNMYKRLRIKKRRVS